MRSKIIEVSSGPEGNWGRFLIQQYDEAEWYYPSAFNRFTTIWKGPPPPLSTCWILDLITGEGATFDLAEPLGPQLERHQVWVCVLYEPFLQWLEQQPRPLDPRTLPAKVELPGVPVEHIGFRHGPWLAELPEAALQFLQHPGLPLPLPLRKLLKKLLPNTSTRG